MTPTQLLSIPSADLAKLSDADLAKLVEPLVPLARTAYSGPRTNSGSSFHAGMKRSAAELDRLTRQIHLLSQQTK